MNLSGEREEELGHGARPGHRELRRTRRSFGARRRRSRRLTEVYPRSGDKAGLPRGCGGAPAWSWGVASSGMCLGCSILKWEEVHGHGRS